MSRVLRTSRAERDLAEIGIYIGVEKSRPTAAVERLDELDEKFACYAKQPHLGLARSDLGDGIRTPSHKGYVVVYRPLDDGIDVLRETIFRSRSDRSTVKSVQELC